MVNGVRYPSDGDTCDYPNEPRATPDELHGDREKAHDFSRGRMSGQNNHRYSDPELREIISRIFMELRGIDHRERYFGRVVNGYMENPYSTKGSFYADEREELKTRVDRLTWELTKLEEAADLDVDLLEDSE